MCLNHESYIKLFYFHIFHSAPASIQLSPGNFFVASNAHIVTFVSGKFLYCAACGFVFFDIDGLNVFTEFFVCGIHDLVTGRTGIFFP